MMKAACAIVVVGLWIYSVFLWAGWRLAAPWREGRRVTSISHAGIKLYLKLSGLAVLGWLILIMG